MATSTPWIDFKQLRAQLRFEDVLRCYHIRLTVKGRRATGFCPLPSHQGKRLSPSFSVQLERNIFQCFGCHAKGNVLDFICRMENLDPNFPQQLRAGALKARNLIQRASTDKGLSATPARQPMAVINEPIDFELRTLDSEHPYLGERGFQHETVRYFGLGFCNRGLLKGRIAIPLHDLDGRLVGYAGRITRDDMISERCPKYLVPGTRERNGVKLQFHKNLLLYNAHRIPKPVDHLFVVEGFPATWWLWQAKFRHVVALMGSSCSVKQAELIELLVKRDGKVWIVSDRDPGGEKCAMSVLSHVSPRRFTRWIHLDEGKQPTDYAADELPMVLI